MTIRRALFALVCAGALVAAAPAGSRAEFDKLVADAKAAMLASPADARKSAAAAGQIAITEPAGPEREQRLATAEWLQGEAALRANDIAGAKPLVERALGRLKRIPGASKLKGDLMMSRGGIHAAEANVGEALTDYQAAHNLFRDIKETRSQSIALATIGTLYATADDAAGALKYFGRALDIYAADPGLAVSLYNNRGFALKDMKRYDQAAAQFAQAMKYARQMGSTQLQGRILGNIARLEIARGDLDAAQRSLAQGLHLASGPEGAAWRPQLNAIAADLALKRGDTARARGLIESSFAGVPLDKTDASYREAHYTAYAIYQALGDRVHALAHLQAMKRLDDQVWKLSASTNTALMAARFDSANQEARIAKLKADDAARQLAMAQAETRFQLILFSVLAFGAVSVLALLGFGLYQSRRARIRLSASNAALEKALAAKTEFLATTSHEIRTPLNGILGMTQVMLADPGLDAKARDRVGIVHGAGLTMRALVDDILDVAKMETGNLTVEAEPFDLKALLDDVTRMWAEQARAKGLTFELKLGDCPRGFVGDSGRVRQMVYNLLSNAVKFTAQGGVTVDARCLGDRLRIAVSDTGIGIAPEKQGEIFESFKQADGGTTRQFGGTGLGLTIVRNIATALGGHVSVESAPGAGATFTVDLPFVAAELPDAVAEPEAGGLLIVDRNPIARAMLKAVLEPRAGRVLFANSCAEAAEQAAGVHQILVDEATARAGDADPIAAIRALADRADAPVAVLWASPDDDVRAALTAAGAIQIVAKPIAGPALAAVLYPSNTQEPLVTQAA
jgi:signal transduction histidine kinase/CheY-like chemotaxis protein